MRRPPAVGNGADPRCARCPGDTDRRMRSRPAHAGRRRKIVSGRNGGWNRSRRHARNGVTAFQQCARHDRVLSNRPKCSDRCVRLRGSVVILSEGGVWHTIDPQPHRTTEDIQGRPFVFHACTNGHAVREVEVGGMLLIEASYPAGTWLPPHQHSRRSLVVVLSGGFRERIGGHEIEVARGSLYLRPPAVHHAHLFGDELTRCLAIELLERPDTTFGPAMSAERPLVFRAGACGRIGSRIARLPWDRQPARRLRLEAQLLELLACVASRGRVPAEEPPEWLQRVHHRLRDSFRDPPSIVELAAEAGVHQSHLLRRFRKHYGLSPTGMVRRCKAEYARALLAEPGASLSAVAFEAGFADQSHMGRVLRRAYGTTPGQMQREEAMESMAHVAPRILPHDPSPHD